MGDGTFDNFIEKRDSWGCEEEDFTHWPVRLEMYLPMDTVGEEEYTKWLPKYLAELNGYCARKGHPILGDDVHTTRPECETAGCKWNKAKEGVVWEFECHHDRRRRLMRDFCKLATE